MNTGNGRWTTVEFPQRQSVDDWRYHTRIHVGRVTDMAKKKAAAKSLGRKSAKASASGKTPAAKKAAASAVRMVAKKKAAVARSLAIKKAATNDIVLTTESQAATRIELESAYPGITKSMVDFRAQLPWGK